MKKQFLFLNSVLSVMVIVLLLDAGVNHQVNVRLGSQSSQMADGVPLPPPVNPPPKSMNGLMADGVPLPPPVNPPPKQATS